MTGVTIDVEIEDAEARRIIARLASATGDLTALHDDIGAQLVTNVGLRFESEMGPGGVPWKASERAEREGGKTLTLTNRLRQSVTHLASPGDVVVGTNVEYAAVHQLGGTIRMPARQQTVYRKVGKDGLFAHEGRFVRRRRANFESTHAVAAYSITMPARPFLGVDDQDRADILAIATDHLRAAGAGAIE